MATTQLDRARAAGAQPYAAPSFIAAGDEIVLMDILFPHKPNEHWIVEQASLIVGCTLRGPTTSGSFPPNSGIFLCPPATIGETLAESQGGINLAARPILLPLGPPGASAATIGAGPFLAGGLWALTLAPGFKCTVPFGWFLRGIVSCFQGSATPGPGINSIGKFTALAYRETDKEPEDCE